MHLESQLGMIPTPTDPLEKWAAFAREAKLADTPAGNKALREATEIADLALEVRELIEGYRAMIVVTRPLDGQKMLVARNQVQGMKTAKERAEGGEPVRDLTKEYYRRSGPGHAARNLSFSTLVSPKRKGGRPRKDPEASKIMSGSTLLDAEPIKRGERDLELERIRATILNGALIGADTEF